MFKIIMAIGIVIAVIGFALIMMYPNSEIGTNMLIVGCLVFGVTRFITSDYAKKNMFDDTPPFSL